MHGPRIVTASGGEAPQLFGSGSDISVMPESGGCIGKLSIYLYYATVLLSSCSDQLPQPCMWHSMLCFDHSLLLSCFASVCRTCVFQFSKAVPRSPLIAAATVLGGMRCLQSVTLSRAWSSVSNFPSRE
jgi:hypothetical protein